MVLFDIIRRTIVSPEFLIALIALWIFTVEPAWLIEVAKVLSTAPDGVKYLSLVPVAVAVWCLQQSKIILFPSEDTKGLIQEWPKFKKLKERVFIGLTYQAIFCTLGIGAWVVSPSLNNGIAIIIIGMSIMGALFGAVTFYLATIMASEITKRNATKI